MKKKIIPFIAAIALIIVVVLFMVLGNIIEKYTPSKETKDLSEYYGLTSDTDVALICNNEVIDTKGKLVNGEVYLSYETVRNYLNARFYWDPNENILRYTTANDLISVNAESSDYTVNKDTQSFGQTIVKQMPLPLILQSILSNSTLIFSTITIRIQTVSFLPMHGEIIPLLLQSKKQKSVIRAVSKVRFLQKQIKIPSSLF